MAPLRCLVAAALISGLVACGKKDRHEPAAPVRADWRRTVTIADMERIRDWRGAFVKALEKARAAGHAASIALEGRLLEPDAALDQLSITPGKFRCRVIKIGSNSAMMGDYVVFPPQPCTIVDEGEVLGFSKPSGTQRPVGILFPAEGRKMMFLGTMVIGDEKRALDYGRDSARDMVGALERVGERRWRLILPWPRMESMMDVIEIVPA
jgi:hypothetical protein